MKRTIKLTENDLKNVVKKVINEMVDNSIFQQFDDHGDFYSGLAYVYKNGCGYNYIKSNGQLLFPNKWLQWAWDFSPNGKARVRYNDEEFLINTKGEVLDYNGTVDNNKLLEEAITRAIRKLLR